MSAYMTLLTNQRNALVCLPHVVGIMFKWPIVDDNSSHAWCLTSRWFEPWAPYAWINKSLILWSFFVAHYEKLGLENLCLNIYFPLWIFLLLEMCIDGLGICYLNSSIAWIFMHGRKIERCLIFYESNMIYDTEMMEHRFGSGLIELF